MKCFSQDWLWLCHSVVKVPNHFINITRHYSLIAEGLSLLPVTSFTRLWSTSWAAQRVLGLFSAAKVDATRVVGFIKFYNTRPSDGGTLVSWPDSGVNLTGKKKNMLEIVPINQLHDLPGVLWWLILPVYLHTCPFLDHFKGSRLRFGSFFFDRTSFVFDPWRFWKF